MTNNDPIEEIDNLQIDDVLMDRLGFKGVESALISDVDILLKIKTLQCYTSHPKHSNTSKGIYRILACTRISLDNHRFVISLSIDVW